MSSVNVITRGERELSLRFDTFPTRARAKLAERITVLTEQLQARIVAATPQGKTGRLRSEETSRILTDNPNRVAGYVQVYAPDLPTEYAKAATLEYGTNKPRKIFERTSGLLGRLSRRRVVARVTRPVHIAPFRFLRQPLEEMKPEIELALDEAMAEVTAEGEA
jgi:hypothetical protein